MNTQVVGGVRPQTGPAREHIKHKYLEALMLIERLHRRLLDVIKDDFERTGEPEVNPVQAPCIYQRGTRMSRHRLHSSTNQRKAFRRKLGHIRRERHQLEQRRFRLRRKL